MCEYRREPATNASRAEHDSSARAKRQDGSDIRHACTSTMGIDTGVTGAQQTTRANRAKVRQLSRLRAAGHARIPLLAALAAPRGPKPRAQEAVLRERSRLLRRLA